MKYSLKTTNSRANLLIRHCSEGPSQDLTALTSSQSVCLFSVCVRVSLSSCLIVPDIPVFVLHCLTRLWSVVYYRPLSPFLHTAVPQRRAPLCLLLHSLSPLFQAPLLFHYHLSLFYCQDILSPVRIPRYRPCAAALFKRPSTQVCGGGPLRPLLQHFPYGRRGERVVFPPARFIGPILMSLGVADWFDMADIVPRAWGEVFCESMRPNETLFLGFSETLPSRRPWGCQGRPAGR